MAVLADLPQEVVTEILVRLPVKYLMRFRCVCKSWLSLIMSDSTYFSRKHINYLNETKNDNDVAILFNFYSASIDTDTGTRISNFTPSTTLISNHHQPCRDNRRSTQTLVSVKEVDFPGDQVKLGNALIKGCCDGILCIVIFDGAFLLNPLINKCKRLPPSDLRHRMCDEYGIGYDPSVDDYKVLKVHYPLVDDDYNDLKVHSQPRVEVFSLKFNRWKKIQDNCPYRLGSRQSQQHLIYTNGGIHLVAKRGSGVSKEVVIVCFDVVTEKFREVPLPHFGNRAIAVDRVLVFRGKLCFAEIDSSIWVMKEYGVRESWSKLLTVPQLKFEWVMPFYITSAGIVISKKGTNEIRIYDSTDETIMKFETAFTYGLQSTIAYVPSLVSPIVGPES